MRKKAAFLALLPLLLSGCASIRRTNRVGHLVFPELRQGTPPAYTKNVLPNGLVLFLMEDRSLPLINCRALIRTGSALDPGDKKGLGEMTFEVMRTGGAGSLAGDEIDETLEHTGSSISAGIGRDSGSISALSDTENFPGVFAIFTAILKSPRFENGKIELARIGQVSTISRRNDDIIGIAEREFRKLLYGKDSPYARTAEYATVNSVTRDDMVEFHKTFFRPENIIIGVWGDFTTGEMVETVKEAFGQWQGKGSPAPPDFPEAAFIPSGPPVNLIVKKDASQSVIMMGHRGLRRDHPDYFTAIVTSRILGMGEYSRFSRSIRQKRGLAYSTWAGFTGGFGYPGPFSASAQTQAGRTLEAMELMREEIKLISKGVTDEELSVAKEGIVNSEVFWSDTTDKIMDRLMRYEYYGYPGDYPQLLLEGVERVSREDIPEFAKKHIFPGGLTVLIVGNPEKFGAPLPGETNIIE